MVRTLQSHRSSSRQVSFNGCLRTYDPPNTFRYSKAYPDARFYKLDVDEVPDVAQELGIRAMPTFLLFRNGEKIAEVVGANPKALEAAIKANYETTA